MLLATQPSAGPDGALVLVSRDHARFLSADPALPTLQTALDDWPRNEPTLRELAQRLEAGEGAALDVSRLWAPLPRAWQWLDGSAFASHGRLMDQALGSKVIDSGLPLMYQGMSHRFLAPREDVPLPDESLGIDFEGEFAVVVDRVPMGTRAAEAAKHIRLVLLLNDWSLRTLAGPEMKTGFGWIQAKPACSVAPIAVTPDELGTAWSNSRVQLNLLVHWNAKRFGNAHGGAMAFGFDELIAHAARTRELCAGTIIGSGTVSNDDFREVGSSCIAERRGIEIVDEGAARTGYMRFGDSVRMEARGRDGAPLFGAIEQKVVKA